MILGTEYLTDRGIDLDLAFKLAVEIESPPSVARIIERLGEDILIGGKPLSQVATTLIWFPCRNSDGIIVSWIARVLPTPNGGPKFPTPKGGSGQPFIAPSVWAVAAQTSMPLVITEGPVKAMALGQAGYAAIGLNGVWCAHVNLPDGKRDLRTELKAFSLAGRKIYICFDADLLTNPKARHAAICLFLMLSAADCEIFELTTWDLTEAKGIDDLFMVRKAADPPSSPSEVMAELEGGATLFIDTFRKTSSVDLKAVMVELANVQLEKLHRHQLCKVLGHVLGVPMEDLKKIGEPPVGTKSSWFVDVAPWETPVDGLMLAAAVEVVFKKHLVLSPAGLVTATLWVFMDYFVDVIDTNPFLGVTSPEKRCGKTTMLEILYQLTRRPIHAANVSSAVVYRTIDKYCPTFLLDELDTFLHRKDELIGILNSGHRKGVVTLRCHPVTLEPVAFSGWCPKALAMIGELPETLLDRALPVRMFRRTKQEKIVPVEKTLPAEWEGLRRQLVRWHQDNEEKVRLKEVALPEALQDRAGQNWVPLCKIAAVLGGEWPKRILEAALQTIAAQAGDGKSFNVSVLIAVRRAFADKRLFKDDDFLPTKDLLAESNRDKTAPWFAKTSLDGLTEHRLAKVLREYGVRPVQIQRVRGYLLKDLIPAFDRYLGSEPPPTSPSPPSSSPSGSGAPPVPNPPSPSSSGTTEPAGNQFSSDQHTPSSATPSKVIVQSCEQVATDSARGTSDCTISCESVQSGRASFQSNRASVTDSGSVGCEPSARLHDYFWGGSGKCNENVLALDFETYAELKKSGKTHDNALDPWRGNIRLLTLGNSAGNIKSFDLKEGPVPPDILHVINESPLIIHNALFDLSWLAVHLDLHPQKVFCTQTAARVLSAGTQLDCDLRSTLERHLGIKLAKGLGGSDWGGMFLSDSQKQYAIGDATHLHALAGKLTEELVAADLFEVFELESKLIPVAVRMRQAGIAVDRAKFDGVLAGLRAESEMLQKEILSDFGLPLDFKLNSPEELLAVFKAERVDLPNTDKNTLKRCDHPLAARILEYRIPQHALDAIPKYIASVTAEGRIHGDFDSHGARTGRFTCHKPALQTVPRGALFRQCFMAPEGRSLIVADYSKMEVVAVAAITQDRALIEALLGKDDFYKAVGSKLFGKPIAEITDRDRAISKTVCLGFQYGLGPEAFLIKLRTETGIELSLEEAIAFRRAYFKQFPGLAKWHAAAREQAPDIDEGRSAFGRRRLLSAKKEATDWDRFQLCINYPVQGGCTDAFKLAMVNLDQAIRELGLDAQIVLCVHDELILECQTGIAPHVCDLTKRTMETAFTTVFGPEVPCGVEAKICSDWSQK